MPFLLLVLVVYIFICRFLLGYLTLFGLLVLTVICLYSVEGCLFGVRNLICVLGVWLLLFVGC